MGKTGAMIEMPIPNGMLKSLDFHGHGVTFDTGTAVIQMPMPVCDALRTYGENGGDEATVIITINGKDLHLPVNKALWDLALSAEDMQDYTAVTMSPFKCQRHFVGNILFGLPMMRWFDALYHLENENAR